jgi:hypothetical protein
MANPVPVFTQTERNLMRVNELLNKRIEELVRAIQLGSYDCEHLHHAKKHQHKYGDPCPVETIVQQALNGHDTTSSTQEEK